MHSKSENIFLKSKNDTYTYGDLDQFTHFFSTFLNDKQVPTGQPIGFLAASCDEYILGIAACWQLGVPFVCFNRDTQPELLQEQINTINPALIFTDDHSTLSKWSRCVPIDEIEMNRVPKNTATITFNAFSDEHIFGYFFTSGTTSTPKIVPLKRRQIKAAARASTKNIPLEANDFWLLCMPLHHVGGISIILRSFIYGSAIYRVDSFQRSIAQLLAEDEKIKAISLVPTMLKRLLTQSDFQSHQDLTILLGGGPVHATLLHDVLSCNLNFITSYGMTETCAQIAAQPVADTSTPPNCAGCIFESNNIEIRDKNKNPLPANKPGTIWLKGPQVFDGYYRQRDQLYFDDDGWFNTGDFGRIDDQEKLYIETRRTDLIITGGENVAPTEVEEALLNIAPIQEAAVIGLDDAEWGQIVAAVLVIMDDKKLTFEYLKEELKPKLEGYKIPKKITFIDKLPRTSSGKIKRRELDKLFV